MQTNLPTQPLVDIDFASTRATILHRFQDEAKILNRNGFAILDGVLPHQILDVSASQMQTLRSHGLLRPHLFGFGHPKPQIFCKPHIFEAELQDRGVHSPGLKSLEELQLHALSAKAFPDLHLNSCQPTIKLQFNEGKGGCFPPHFDNPGGENKRKLTILLYLNSAWDDQSGGELELMPWLQPSVRIAPVYGRVVLFLSQYMLHRVLPSCNTRYCITFWIHSDSIEDSPLRIPRGAPTSDMHELVRKLQFASAQRLLSRSTYAREYSESLLACMKDAPPAQLEAMLSGHTAHLTHVESNPLLASLVLIAKDLRSYDTVLVTDSSLKAGYETVFRGPIGTDDSLKAGLLETPTAYTVALKHRILQDASRLRIVAKISIIENNLA